MEIVNTDSVKEYVDSKNNDYDINNPIMRLVEFVEHVEFAAEREHYVADSLEYVVPYRQLELYAPQSNTDPRTQDEKNDFHKQNVHDFELSDFYIARGYATATNWTGAFVKVSYRGGPASAIGKQTLGNPPESLRLNITIGGSSESNLVIPYNPVSDRYEAEFWSFNNSNSGLLRDRLGQKGIAALDAGLIQELPDLVKGTPSDFSGPKFDEDRDVANRNAANPNLPEPTAIHLFNRAPNHTLHPVRTLRLNLAWSNEDGSKQDDNGGTGYIVEFSMIHRGWNRYLQVGNSPNPHGGVGVLEFRNLMSSYFTHEKLRRDALGSEWENELGRNLNGYNFNAYRHHPNHRPEPNPEMDPPLIDKGPLSLNGGSPVEREMFMAVEYMDLHILQPDCGIGIHRHRDNQEVFLLMQGKGLMIVGDWCRFGPRERAFEIHTMLPGDLTLCKTGQLHALYNSTDQPSQLFMFGAYD